MDLSYEDKEFANHLEFFIMYLSLKIAYITHSRELIFQGTIDILKFYISRMGKMRSYGFYSRLNLYAYRDILLLPAYLILPFRMSRFRLRRFY